MRRSIEDNIFYQMMVLYFKLHRQEPKSASNQIFSKFLSMWFSRTTHANWTFFLIDSLDVALQKSILNICPRWNMTRSDMIGRTILVWSCHWIFRPGLRPISILYSVSLSNNFRQSIKAVEFYFRGKYIYRCPHLMYWPNWPRVRVWWWEWRWGWGMRWGNR